MGDATASASGPAPVGRLDIDGLGAAVARLAESDADLRRVFVAHGVPPLWDREPGFATLVHVILEQQVSLASAAAAMERLVASIGPPEPEPFLELDDESLFRIGFSRQKRVYARDLAQRLLDGRLDLDGLTHLTDSEVRERLMEVKGIGRWTADVYLLMVLLRPDVWPEGDRALVVAARELKGMPEDPAPEDLRGLAETWRPWRSVGARLLWHFYLSEVRPPGGRAG